MILCQRNLLFSSFSNVLENISISNFIKFLLRKIEGKKLKNFRNSEYFISVFSFLFFSSFFNKWAASEPVNFLVL